MASCTILVAEDSPTMRLFITFSLKRIPNVRILEASDGVQAMQKLAQEKVDLILLDINMPLMGGMEVMKRVRQDDKLKSIPVVMLTTESDLREEGTQLGANAFLAKPVRVEELYKTVKQFLSVEI